MEGDIGYLVENTSLWGRAPPKEGRPYSLSLLKTPPGSHGPLTQSGFELEQSQLHGTCPLDDGFTSKSDGRE